LFYTFLNVLYAIFTYAIEWHVQAAAMHVR
jgi:hypothetical protein